MTERIADATAPAARAGWHHRARCPLDLAGALDAAPAGRPVLVDCLTLWLSQPHARRRRRRGANAERLAAALAAPRGPWVAVANEVGLGIVPDNALARRFRDAAGRLNQRVAAVADSVVLMVAGLPLQVK